MFCPYCGNKLEDSSHFCSNCGARIDGQNAEKREDSFEPTSVASERHDNFEFDFNDVPPVNAQSNQSAPQSNQTKSVDEDTGAAVGFGILAFFFPIVGFILFALWNKEMPRRAKSCLIGAVVSIAAGVFAVMIYVFLLIAYGITYTPPTNAILPFLPFF